MVSGKLSDEEAKDLAEVLTYLGEPGKGDVRIAFGDLKGKAWGEQLDLSSGLKGIKIDMAAIISESTKSHFGFSFDIFAEVGGGAAHEGRHGVNRDSHFRIRQEYLERDLIGYGERERSAYFSGSLVFKGLGASSAHFLWQARWEREGLNEAQINELRNIGIQKSVGQSIDMMREDRKAKGFK